ncbi:MAG: twin-arginine translocase subunit TatC [Deltaproteobacteria bacterium]|nr:twin-arginine translocase subunit TatC [Deltaproteobacteria bacterium]
MAKQRAASEEEEPESPPSDLEESRMPFLAHLRELRDRVRNAAIFFMLAFALCWWRAKDIYNLLKAPLFNVWETEKLGKPHIVFGKLTEPFWVDMSIALWAGIFVASPFIFYQLWKFIAPGLYKRERKITVAFAIFSALFFISGAAFCYRFVLENLYGFLLDYGDKELLPMIMMQDYLDLTRNMMLAFGAVFELPLLIYFLAMVGLVTHRSLWKFNRWFVVIAFIVGAILTPSPDVVSQLMMAAPMIVLYNISILFAWRVTLKRERAAKELSERESAADAAERAKRGTAAEDEDDEEEED